MMEEAVIMTDSNDESPKHTLSYDKSSNLLNINANNYFTSSLNHLHNNLSDSNESGVYSETSRLQVLEQEQEQLNASLMALTTHFGQVQFRLKQIVASPEQDKERLLKELEEFAFRGCPNLNPNNRSLIDLNNLHDKIIEEQRIKQKNLIDKLKQQLQDLENYAYQSGDSDELPSNLIIEKHKIIINELKEKINLPLENINKLSNEDLKKVVDSAILKIINPTKVKEHLVLQLKTQIEDLERFIDFLQGEASSPGPYLNKQKQCNCSNQASNSAFPMFQQPIKTNDKNLNSRTDINDNNIFNNDRSQYSNESTIDLIKKVLSVMQIFAVTQLGCGTKPSFEKNSLKKTSNHWGDLRANLELSVNKVLKINLNFVETKKKDILKQRVNVVTTESDEELAFESPHELIRAIRKDLANSLRDLMQHGLMEVSHDVSIVPFGCFAVRSKGNQTQLHIWDLLTKYYEMKHGKEFTQSAANKLSQSFSLNVVAGKVITIKQSLLNAIETIMKIHKYDISNKDSCFKAFICLALNEKKLVLYLKQILKTTVLIENYYLNWSYIKTTGFDDALKSLDQLKVLNSNLPVEKSIKRKSINNSNSQNKDLF